jgi:predicted phage tail protein
MRDIVLHGPLGARFGERFCLDVRDAAEAIRALGTQLPGFREAIGQGSWHLVRGPLIGGSSLPQQDLTLALGQARELHILPAIEGAGGAFNAVLGVALIAVAWWNPMAWAGATALMVGATGAALAVSGVMQMSAVSAAGDYAQRERPDQRPSFLFDGPVNTSTQGPPVPIICGRVRTGSVVISAGMTAEQI